MIKNGGIDALVNECLIGPVLTMGATFIAYACALSAYLYLIFTSPAYNSSGTYTPVVAFAFLIGLQICNIFITPIASGIDTIFVALEWDPEVLMRDRPDLYGRMVLWFSYLLQIRLIRAAHIKISSLYTKSNTKRIFLYAHKFFRL